MDYLAINIPELTEREVEGKLYTDGAVTLHKVHRRKIRFLGNWESLPKGIEEVDYTDHPDFPICWSNASDCPLSVFDVFRDPSYVPGERTPAIMHLGAVGSAEVSGEGPWDIEIDLAGKNSASVILEIHDAVITPSEGHSGEIQIAYSNDRQQWHSGSFRDSSFLIDQSNIGSGCVFQRDIDFSKIGRYISLRYRVNRVAGWGHKSTITVVAGT